MPRSAFCSSLEWSVPIKWLDLTGMFQYPDGRLARIELSTRGTVGHYPGFLVSIVSPTAGPIDKKYFRFDDYMSRELEHRKDDRDNWPMSADGLCFHVCDHCGWKWYIAEPKTTKPYCEAVETYIGLFA